MEASALTPQIRLGRLSVAGPLLRLRSDEQLVALFRGGHDAAFQAIHDRYRARVLAYIRQMLPGGAADAEDVLQDVLLRAYHALRADERPILLRAWLYRVAHNRCVDQIRRPCPPPADIYDLNRPAAEDPPAAAERREDLRRLVADVGRLPEQQRSALLMREMEGLSYQELALALGVTIPAVKSLLVRARIGLVEAIEARDTACREIRNDLATTTGRGVRASGRARRHLQECAGCREYRTALRGVERGLGALSPGSGVLASVAKLLGIGGSGAAAGGGIAAGGGAVAAGGTTAGTGLAAAAACKIAAVAATAVVVGGGAATVTGRHHHAPPPPRPAAQRASTVVPAQLPRAAPVAVRAQPIAGTVQKARPRDASHARPLASTGALAADTPPNATVPGTEAPTETAVPASPTGGLAAPAETSTDPPANTPTTAVPSGGTPQPASADSGQMATGAPPAGATPAGAPTTAYAAAPPASTAPGPGPGSAGTPASGGSAATPASGGSPAPAAAAASGTSPAGPSPPD